MNAAIPPFIRWETSFILRRNSCWTWNNKNNQNKPTTYSVLRNETNKAEEWDRKSLLNRNCKCEEAIKAMVNVIVLVFSVLCTMYSAIPTQFNKKYDANRTSEVGLKVNVTMFVSTNSFWQSHTKQPYQYTTKFSTHIYFVFQFWVLIHMFSSVSIKRQPFWNFIHNPVRENKSKT